jgi:hypothetical protein
MIKEYRYLKDFSNKDFIQEMMKINDSMYEILEAIDDGHFQNDIGEIKKLNIYIKSLVEGQRSSLGRTVEGSWGLVPNDEGIDSDGRVEFIFKPTYIATATLSRFLLEFPLYAFSIKNYKDALYKGMIFCTYRGLYGHGYDQEDGAIETLKILSMGKVPYLLKQHPDFCPELKKVIDITSLQ